MNCFTKQRIVSLLMVGSLMAGSMPSVLALDGYNGVKDIPGVGNSEVTLTVENTGGSGGGDTPVDPDVPPVDPPVDPVIFSAYVPAELPIKMDLDGGIVVPDNAMIINAVETKGIKVSEINVALESGWSASNWEDDFSAKEENSKELGLKLRSDYLSSDGSFSLNSDDWKIFKNSYIPLEMGAKLPKQTEAGNKGKIATISFTLDWSGDDVSVGPEIPGGNPNGGGSSGGGSETPDVPADISTLNVEWENGLLLPGSTKTATFNWDSTNQNDKIVNLVSSNEDIAIVPDLGSIPTPMSETTSYKGSLPIEVTAVSRGTSTITATLESGATTTFDVQVSEIDTNSGSEPSGEVKPDSSFNEGDTLKPGDITVTIPVVKPDGSTEDIVVTPDTVPDTPLVEGENNIEITVDVNGVKVIINVIINIASSNPSNGMQQSVADAQAMGFTFAAYEDGLEINGFENKQFKSEINIPENIGDFKVLKIGDNAFEGQTNIKKITMPDTVKVLGTAAFSGCTNLEEINIPDTFKVLGNEVFSDCSKIQKLSTNAKFTTIGCWAFRNCTSLNSLDFSSVENIQVEAFLNCTSLDIVLTDAIHKIEYRAFNGAKSVTICDAVIAKANNNKSYNYIASTAFSGTNVYIPNNITLAAKDTGLFSTYEQYLPEVSIKSLHIEGETIPIIGSSALANCKVNTIYISGKTGYLWSTYSYNYNSIMESIGKIVFEEGVEEIVGHIGGSPLEENLGAINIVEIPSTVKSISSDAFSRINKSKVNIRIKAPEGSIEGSPWGATKAQITWLL